MFKYFYHINIKIEKNNYGLLVLDIMIVITFEKNAGVFEKVTKGFRVFF